MLDCIPFEGGTGVPPIPPPRGWKESFLARQRCCVAIMHMAQAASEQLLPFLEALAGRIERLWQQGEVRIGERSILCEALLAVSVASDVAKQSEALAWTLAPVQAHWSEDGFQQSLQSPQHFFLAYMGIPGVAPGFVGGQESRWVIYHEIVLIERSLRRLVEKSPADALHPFLSYYEWSLPWIVSLLRLIQYCWTREGRQVLSQVAGALSMSKAERLSALGAPTSTVSAAHREEDDERGAGGDTAYNLREFLRGSRECCFQIIALTAGRLEGFFELRDMPSHLASSLVGNLHSMENRHLRMMIRTVFSVMCKKCPPQYNSEWLGPILPPLHLHMQQRLHALWQACEARLDGNASGNTSEEGPSVENEVLEERILRELTREYAGLLVQNIEQGGKGANPAAGARSMSDQTLDWMMVEHPNAVEAVLATCCSMLCWPDSEAAGKAIVFCRMIVCYADTDPRFYEIVGDILRAGLRALTVPSNSALQAELLSLLRDIIMKTSQERPLPLQILVTLPGVHEADVRNLLTSLHGTGSDKEQRVKLKQFLLSSGGELLKAIPKPKSAPWGSLGGNKMGPTRKHEYQEVPDEDPAPLWFLT